MIGLNSSLPHCLCKLGQVLSPSWALMSPCLRDRVELHNPQEPFKSHLPWMTRCDIMLPNTGNMHIEKVDRETKAIKSAPKEGDYQWLSLMVPR